MWRTHLRDHPAFSILVSTAGREAKTGNTSAVRRLGMYWNDNNYKENQASSQQSLHRPQRKYYYYSTNFSASGLVSIRRLILQSQLVLSKFGRSLRYCMLSMTSNVYQISTKKEPANREAPEDEVGRRSSTVLVELKNIADNFTRFA